MENVYLCNRFRNLVQPFKNTNMATYKITLEFETVLSVDGLYMHSKFVGEYAKVDVLDVNGKPVKSI